MHWLKKLKVNSLIDREFHGALKDAKILTDVYLELQGVNQMGLQLEENQSEELNLSGELNLKTIVLTKEETEAHKEFIKSKIPNSNWAKNVKKIMSSEFIDIVLFGAIAIFLVYRLRSILGSSDGKIVNIRTKKNPQSKFKPKIVPKNENNEFLDGASKAYEMIVQAYQSNNIEKVKDLLTPEAMQAMEQAKAPKEIKFSEVKASSILDDKSDDLRLIKSVKFRN